MGRDVVETPWGPLAVLGGSPASVGDMHATRKVMVPTVAGRAETGFFVDVGRGNVPEHLRVVLLGGYAPPGLLSGGAAPSGQTTLMVGGTLFGWRAQAYLDPATGDLAEGRGIEVGLIDGTGKFVRSFPPAEEAVRAAVTAAVGAARDQDPGMTARIYVSLMASVAQDLDEAVDDAEAALAEARRLRDRAAALVEGASEAAAGYPIPGR